MLTPGIGLPPLFSPIVSRKKDYHAGRAFGTFFSCISTHRAPFDNVLLRYALNMATDKKVLAEFMGPGYEPARSLVSALAQYPQPKSLNINVDGTFYEVMGFGVAGARSLLAKAGFPGGIGSDGRRLEVTYHFPATADSRPRAEILQQQWLQNLNLQVKLIAREFNVHSRMVDQADYTGLADSFAFPLYLDPNGFLEQFPSDGSINPSGWSDPDYASELNAANAILNRPERLTRLAACERRLLNAMPFLSLFHSAYGFLCKPFVCGLGRHPPFDMRAFKYIWIDTNWRPQ
jgi:oligopeptide transport system substrate-binding protein